MALSDEAVQAAGLGETRAWLVDTGVDGIWHEATVVGRGEGGTATLRRDDGVGEPVVVSAEELKLVNTLPEAGVEDMTKLDYLHEPALLRNLHRRFGQAMRVGQP
jgi:myosin heavy subunit